MNGLSDNINVCSRTLIDTLTFCPGTPGSPYKKSKNNQRPQRPLWLLLKSLFICFKYSELSSCKTDNKQFGIPLLGTSCPKEKASSYSCYIDWQTIFIES